MITSRTISSVYRTVFVQVHFLCELAQVRLTFHPGSEISDTLISLLLDIIEYDPGHHNVFRFDSQPVYGVKNVYFGLLLDVVVVLKHDVSELLAARVH